MDENIKINSSINELKEDTFVDCTGLYCPVPLYEARKKINELKDGQVLKLIADDPTSEVDLKAWSRTTGNEILSLKKEGNKLTYYIKKTLKK